MKTRTINIQRIIAVVSFMTALIGLQAQTDNGISSVDTTKNNVQNDNITVAKLTFPFCRHEFSLWTAEGISGLNYKPAFGEKDLKVGGNLIGLGYTYYFSPVWGIHTGAELALYNTTYSLKNLKDAYKTTDLDDLTPGRQGENIDYHTDIARYEEKQRLYSVNIPLILQFQTPLNGGVHNYYAALGAKLGIPLKGSYKANGMLDTWAFYYDEATGTQQILASDNEKNFHLEDLGYYDDLAYNSGKQNLKLKIAGLATFETGVKWGLSPKVSLYTGAYIDYGFTNIAKESGKNFFSFDPEQGEVTSSSVLSSQYAHNYGERKDFVEKISPLSFGIKLRLGVNMCSAAKLDKVEKSRKTAEKENIEDKNGESKHNEEPLDAYRKGVQDGLAAAKDILGDGSNAKNQPVKPWNDESDYQYQKDPMYNIEMARAQAEYGKLKDLLILYVDGYELNQAYLSPIMKQILNDRLKLLQKYNSDKYVIIAEGHTCDLGREEFNMALGQKRAEVVRDYMIGKGFNGDNIIPVSKGETTPIVGNTSEANRKINRRVVFLIKERR